MSGNFSFRIGAILLGGFLVLQLVMVVLMAIPGRGGTRESYGLPTAPALAQMVRAMEAAGSSGAQDIADSYSGSLFTVEIADAAPTHYETIPDSMRGIAATYRTALDDHNVVIDGGPGWLAPLAGARLDRAVQLATPIRVTIWLRDGKVLIITGQPSEGVRRYLLQRSLLGLLGGLVLLVALLAAVRQTTGPLVRLADYARAIGTDLDAPDVEPRGSSEIRGLAQAFNQMKHQILRLVEERTLMLAGIAHDMRTFLTRLRLRAEFIEDADQHARAVADLDAMTALLDDSLLFARLGNEAVALEVIDLVALTRELAAEMSVDPGDEQGSVSLSLPAQPVIVMGDRTALARIFNNLVENARRHASAVTVAIEDGPDAIEWRFEDDGPGVPPESLAELGQPFLRLDKSRDRRSGGAGLGLAIIKGLARSMNGSTRFYMCGMGGLGIAVSLPRKTD